MWKKGAASTLYQSEKNTNKINNRAWTIVKISIVIYTVLYHHSTANWNGVGNSNSCSKKQSIGENNSYK